MHTIESAQIHYENLQVKVKGVWYYMNLDKLKGVKVKGNIVKRRTRTWLE